MIRATEAEMARSDDKSIFNHLASVNKGKRKHIGNIYNFTDSDEEDIKDINENMKKSGHLGATAEKRYLPVKLSKENKKVDPGGALSKESIGKGHSKLTADLKSPSSFKLHPSFSNHGNSEPESPVFMSFKNGKYAKCGAEKDRKKKMKTLEIGSSKGSSRTHGCQVTKMQPKHNAHEKKRQGTAAKMERLLNELESSTDLSVDSNNEGHPTEKRVTQSLRKVRLKKCRVNCVKTVTSKYFEKGKSHHGAENFSAFMKSRCNTKGSSHADKHAEALKVQDSPGLFSSCSDTSSSQLMDCLSADELISSGESFQANNDGVRRKIQNVSCSPVNAHKCFSRKSPSPLWTEHKHSNVTSEIPTSLKKSKERRSSEDKELSISQPNKSDRNQITKPKTSDRKVRAFSKTSKLEMFVRDLLSSSSELSDEESNVKNPTTKKLTSLKQMTLDGTVASKNVRKVRKKQKIAACGRIRLQSCQNSSHEKKIKLQKSGKVGTKSKHTANENVFPSPDSKATRSELDSSNWLPDIKDFDIFGSTKSKDGTVDISVSPRKKRRSENFHSLLQRHVAILEDEIAKEQPASGLDNGVPSYSSSTGSTKSPKKQNQVESTEAVTKSSQRDTAEEVKDIGCVTELKKHHIHFLIEKYRDRLKDVMSGKIEEAYRHFEYKKGPKARAMLAYNMPASPMTDEQHDIILGRLVQIFCHHHPEYSKYVMSVLFPEVLILIYCEVHLTSYEETEEAMEREYRSLHKGEKI